MTGVYATNNTVASAPRSTTQAIKKPVSGSTLEKACWLYAALQKNPNDWSLLLQLDDLIHTEGGKFILFHNYAQLNNETEKAIYRIATLFHHSLTADELYATVDPRGTESYFLAHQLLVLSQLGFDVSDRLPKVIANLETQVTENAPQPLIFSLAYAYHLQGNAAKASLLWNQLDAARMPNSGFMNEFEYLRYHDALHAKNVSPQLLAEFRHQALTHPPKDLTHLKQFATDIQADYETQFNADLAWIALENLPKQYRNPSVSLMIVDLMFRNFVNPVNAYDLICQALTDWSHQADMSRDDYFPLNYSQAILDFGASRYGFSNP